jgi:hypothetical protein
MCIKNTTHVKIRFWKDQKNHTHSRKSLTCEVEDLEAHEAHQRKTSFMTKWSGQIR